MGSLVRLTDLRACFSRLCAAGALGLLPALWMPPSADAFVTSADDQPLLFGTLEFRGLSGGGWYDFPQKVAETLDLFSRCADSADTCENPELTSPMTGGAMQRGGLVKHDKLREEIHAVVSFESKDEGLDSPENLAIQQ